MRRSVAGILAAVVVVAMTIGVWRYVRPLDQAGELHLAVVEGQVSLTGPGRDGRAVPGMPIQTHDQITTRQGRAILELDGGTRVRVGPTSSVQVVGIDETGVQIEIEEGAARATVRPGSGSVALSGAGVTAQSIDGEFEVGVRGSFAVVQTQRGEVAVMGADITRLEAGQRAVIRDRAAAVGPIPDDLLLSVAWPEARRTRSTMGTVSGTTSPGATVVVEGAFGRKVVMADVRGHFEVRVPLSEGENPVRVSATDLFGEQAQVRGVLQTRDTSPPTLRGTVEYGP